MTTFISKFESFALSAEAPVFVPPPTPPETVTMDHPAVSVMTDLKRIRAITIGPEMPVGTALQVMIYGKVRLVVVLDGSGCVVGVVSARDLMGEKPVRVATEQRTQHSKVRVEQVMTPRDELDPLHIDDVERATVMDIVRELRDCGRQHAIVVEPRDGSDGFLVRGVFSITQIGRQLGITISPEGPAQDFAELEHLLAGTSQDAT
jgi:CBS domain-containing protein